MSRRAFIILLVFLIDRLLKWYVEHLPTGAVFSFGPGLNFGYYLNPALFFFPAWRWIPWVALGTLIVLISFYGLGFATRNGVAKRFRHNRTTTPYNDTGCFTPNSTFLPILLGGASNVFDRFAYGGVIDYVNIFGVATINVADILIGTGLIILILKPYVQRG